MKKWQYEIIVQMYDGTEYLVWTYSKHFYHIDMPTRKQRKIFKKAECVDTVEWHGIAHSHTAVQWVNGIWNDIYNEREDRVKDGKFNPHFRIATKDIWVEINDIKEIYFKMHLLDKGEQPKQI